MCKFSLEGSGGLLNVLFEHLIKVTDWSYKKISDTHYYLFTQRRRRNQLYINAFNLTGLQRCVMLWILDSRTKTVGPSISYAPNRDLLDCFILLERNNLILLDHKNEINGTWTELSVFFEYPESDPSIIRNALSKGKVQLLDSTDTCKQVFLRLEKI